jgi:methylated-DNA-[protein]-cysteine S-methyltransferase
MNARSERLSFSIYATRAGHGAIVADNGGIVAHHLPYGERTRADALDRVERLFPGSLEDSDLTSKAAALLTRYFAGEPVGFDLPLALDGITPFRRAVYLAVARIPYGTVLSYGQVAAACGSPGAARAVGGAMAANTLPILIPCHRVVGERGKLVGFTAPGGLASKRELLVMEGVVFDAAGGLAGRKV